MAAAASQGPPRSYASAETYSSVGAGSSPPSPPPSLPPAGPAGGGEGVSRGAPCLLLQGSPPRGTDCGPYSPCTVASTPDSSVCIGGGCSATASAESVFRNGCIRAAPHLSSVQLSSHDPVRPVSFRVPSADAHGVPAASNGTGSCSTAAVRAAESDGDSLTIHCPTNGGGASGEDCAVIRYADGVNYAIRSSGSTSCTGHAGRSSSAGRPHPARSLSGARHASCGVSCACGPGRAGCGAAARNGAADSGAYTSLRLSHAALWRGVSIQLVCIGAAGRHI